MKMELGALEQRELVRGLGLLEQGELVRGSGLLEQGELVRDSRHGLHIETPFSSQACLGRGKKGKNQKLK